MIARVSSLRETWSKYSDKMYSMKINDVVKYVQYATKHLRVGPNSLFTLWWLALQIV